jgi:hypothetical protein
MKIYVDCVSGYSHLISLSNARFKELGEDTAKSRGDERMRVLHLFERCYFEGAVSSHCGRRVIDAAVLIKNLNKTLSKLQTKLGRFALAPIIAAAFKGISDNCADLGEESSYFPAETAKAANA